MLWPLTATKRVFTPEWARTLGVVAVRGEDYVSVIDPVKMVRGAAGQNRHRSRHGSVFAPTVVTPSSRRASRARIRRDRLQPATGLSRVYRQASPFSPNLAVSDDGKEVWFTLKGHRESADRQRRAATSVSSRRARYRADHQSRHVGGQRQRQIRYVTIGGLNEVKVYRRGTSLS